MTTSNAVDYRKDKILYFMHIIPKTLQLRLEMASLSCSKEAAVGFEKSKSTENVFLPKSSAIKDQPQISDR